MLATREMDGFEFAALDTLQHRLAGDAKRAHCFSHRQEVFTGVVVEEGLEVIGQANAPGGTGRKLLACDEAVLSRRWMVDGATPSTIAAFLI